MNMHVPQSLKAAAELEHLAAVPHHIISPSTNSPIISSNQDNIVGVFKITDDATRLTQIEALQLLSGTESFDGILPEPAIREGKRLFWTGKQIYSLILPKITLFLGNIVINNGQLLKGQINKGSSKKIVHTIHNEYGRELTERYMNDLQALATRFLVKTGFSVGVSDLVLHKDIGQMKGAVVEEYKRKENDLYKKVHLNILENITGNLNDTFENKITEISSQTDDKIFKNTYDRIDLSNRINYMVTSGAKGKKVNIKQMMCCLGQQSLEGKRVPLGFTGRTLPHYPKYENNMESRGFIVSSYLSGLSPLEFFFHAMSGRIGLIDTAVKTAESGYLQRKLIKAMEDLSAGHDGSVRDVNGNIIQTVYGADGFDAAKLEKVKSNWELIDKETLMDTYIILPEDKMTYMTKATIASMMKKHKNWKAKLNELNKKIQSSIDLFHVHLIKFHGRSDKIELYYPINFKILVDKVKRIFALDNFSKTKSKLNPVDIFNQLEELLDYLKFTDERNHVAELLVYDHLSPKRIIKEYHFHQEALDYLINEAKTLFDKARINAGEMVGVVAGQSIGEISTQLTLNSVEWNTELLIKVDGVIQRVKIGEWIDERMKNASKVNIEKHPNDTTLEYVKDKKIEIMAVNKQGEIVWDNVSAVTKHPPNNKDGSHTLVKVKTDSGREVIATRAKSFLKRIDNQILPVKGSDLKVGDYVPISTVFLKPEKEMTEWIFDELIPKNKYIYMSEVEKAINCHKEIVIKNGKRHWYKANNNNIFTLPFKRSDTFMDSYKSKYCCADDINNVNGAEYKKKCIYPKCRGTGNGISGHMPEKFELDELFGFFVGAYLAEGHSTKYQVLISNIDEDYNAKLLKFCDKYSFKYHYDDKICDNGGHSKTVRIHSYILAQLFIQAFGRTSDAKRLYAPLLGANDEFLKGVIDGYISGDGCVCKKNQTVVSGSISYGLLQDIQCILAKFNIFSKITTRHKALEYNLERGLKARLSYGLSLYRVDSYKFKNTFRLTIKEKQKRLDDMKKPRTVYSSKDIIPDIKTEEFGLITIQRNKLASYIEKCKIDADKKVFENIKRENVMYDKIIAIEEYESEHNYVYDLTCDKTKNFCGANNYPYSDTFHLAGVASKGNITLGVPRLKELLSLQKKLKNPQNVVYLDEEYKYDTDKATIVMNNISETKIGDIIVNDPVFYLNPEKAGNNILEEDKTFMKFYDIFQDVIDTDKSIINNNPWVIRLEFDRKKMLYKNISMSDINVVLMNQFPEATTMYSDDNSGKLVFRLNLSFDSDLNVEDDYNNLRSYSENIKETIIKGISNIKNAFINDDETNKYGNLVVAGRESCGYTSVGEVYEPKKEVYITTEGTNLIDILMMDNIDKNRSYSIDPLEMYSIFGIEAASHIIKQQFKSIMTDDKTNIHHIGLLVDKMCHNGYFMSVDRFGINKEDIGPLAKASFEETALILKNASVFGETDNLKGVSSTIIVGQIANCGTGVVKLFLDEEFMINRLNEIGFDEDKTVLDVDGDGMDVPDICVDDGEQIRMAHVKGDNLALDSLPQVEVDF